MSSNGENFPGRNAPACRGERKEKREAPAECEKGRVHGAIVDGVRILYKRGEKGEERERDTDQVGGSRKGEGDLPRYRGYISDW